MTPFELREQRFTTAVRGFDRKEVTSVVSELAREYEEALHEADRWRDELARAQSVLGEHREQERNLRATLHTAQKLTDGIRHTAEQESQRIVAEAQGRAAALAEQTPAQLEPLEQELAALRETRARVRAEFEATIATLRATLDTMRAR
jgi:cell division initiation protein